MTDSPSESMGLGEAVAGMMTGKHRLEDLSPAMRKRIDKLRRSLEVFTATERIKYEDESLGKNSSAREVTIKIGFKYPHGISSYTINGRTKERRTIRGPEAAKYDGILVNVSKQISDDAEVLLDGPCADMLAEEMLTWMIAHMAGNADAKGNIRGLYRVSNGAIENFGEWFADGMGKLSRMIEGGSAPKVVGFNYGDHISRHVLIGPDEQIRLDPPVQSSDEKCDVLIDVSDPSMREIINLYNGPYEHVVEKEAFVRMAFYMIMLRAARSDLRGLYNIMYGDDADNEGFEDWFDRKRHLFTSAEELFEALDQKKR